MSEEKNDRFVGKATPALTIRQKWHQECFKRVDNKDNAHPNRRSWVPLPGALSLKAFARKLAAAGDQDAKNWLDNKRGRNNTPRSEASINRAKVTASATKASRSKKK